MKNYSLLIAFVVLTVFLSQGFQCASPDMTAAKIAIKNKDYPKAEDYLNKEITKNPGNEEAYILLIEIKYNQGNYLGAAKELNTAQKVIKSPEMAGKIPPLKYMLWVNLYNEGFNYLNSFIKSKTEKYADSALLFLDAGIGIRPEKLEFYSLKAAVLEASEDTAASMEVYKQYIDKAKNEIDFSKSSGIYIGLDREKVIEKLGKSKQYAGFKEESGDSTGTDLYNIDNKEVFVFYSKNKSESMKTVGWRVNLPVDWQSSERERPFFFNTLPFASVAAYYYFNKKQPEKALEYIKLWLQIEPSNKDANNSLVIIYSELGKTDEALKYVEEQSKKEPNNPVYLAQRGDLLFNMGKWDESIFQYEAAIRLNPEFWNVYRNCASAFKNKAVIIQQNIQDQLEKDPKFKYDPSEYTPFLKKSAEYFEKCLSSEDYQNDFLVFGELANIYEVLDEKENLKRILTKLEEMELLLEDKDRESFLLILVKIYSNMKDSKKLEETQKKLKEWLGE